MKALNTQRRRLPLVIWLTLWLLFIPAGGVMAQNDSPAPPPVDDSDQPDAQTPMTDIHDIRPPVPVGVDIPWWGVAGGVLAVLVLAALLWWWRRRKRPPAVETIVPELPPEMIARAALDRISYVRGQDGKAFYFQLSAILRQYVCGRFGIGAPEMTTEEFAPCIERLPIDRELARQLKLLCRAMDPVKFAGQRVNEKQMQEDLYFVRGFVRRTTPNTGVVGNEDTEKQPDGFLETNDNPKRQIPMLKQ